MEAKLKTRYQPFSAAMRRCVDENKCTVKSLAEAGHRTEQTIRNWMEERTAVDEDVAHIIAITHPNPEVCRILMEARVSGSTCSLITDCGETDINKDGRTDIHDALASQAEVTEHASTELRQLLADSNGGLNDQEIQRAMNGLSKLEHEIRRTKAAIEKATRGQRTPIRFTGT